MPTPPGKRPLPKPEPAKPAPSTSQRALPQPQPRPKPTPPPRAQPSPPTPAAIAAQKARPPPPPPASHPPARGTAQSKAKVLATEQQQQQEQQKEQQKEPQVQSPKAASVTAPPLPESKPARPLPTATAAGKGPSGRPLSVMKPKHAPPTAPPPRPAAPSAAAAAAPSATPPAAPVPPKKTLPVNPNANAAQPAQPTQAQAASPEGGETAPVKPPPALTGDARRDQIANELLVTERTYVELLGICVEQFLKPLRAETSTLLPQEKVTAIFSNIEDILQMNTVLLHDLEERMESWSDGQCIGDLFVRLAPFLRIYTAYVSNFDDASATLETCEKLPAFAAFLKERFEDPVCKGQSLRSFLILPVQRIPRYRLLLEDMVKNTRSTHADYAPLTESLTTIKEVATQINDAVKKHENRMKIISIQQRINTLMSNLNLVEAHRLFIREGPLLKVCRKTSKWRECFLFNDLFFYASVLPTGGLLVHRVIGLNELTIVDLPDSDTQKCAFQIGSLKKSFVLCAETQQLKADWLVDIFSAIGELKRATDTLRREDSVGAAPAVTGEAPVWQPDSSVTSCPLCNAEFSLWNRRVCASSPPPPPSFLFFVCVFSRLSCAYVCVGQQHHCRSCGKVVCGNCSQQKLILPIDTTKQRVCDTCYNEFRKYKAQQGGGGGGGSSPRAPTEEQPAQ